jgi:multisubunit Na+/H+ antiporter MnhG subunit
MIRGTFSVLGAVILGVLLIRVVQGEMRLIDVAVRGLVIVVVISLIDKVVAPMVGAALNGVGVRPESKSSDGPVT